jgi:hypothetical protein
MLAPHIIQPKAYRCLHAVPIACAYLRSNAVHDTLRRGVFAMVVGALAMADFPLQRPAYLQEDEYRCQRHPLQQIKSIQPSNSAKICRR